MVIYKKLANEIIFKKISIDRDTAILKPNKLDCGFIMSELPLNETVENLIKNIKFRDDNIIKDMGYVHSIFNDISSNIHSINSITLKDSIEKAVEFVECEDNSFYGCLWVSGNYIFNLLHPAVAYELMNGRNNDILNCEGNMYLYFYRDDFISIYMKTYSSDIVEWIHITGEKNIMFVEEADKLNLIDRVNLESVKRIKNSILYSINTLEEEDKELAEQKRLFYIPNHYATESYSIPYYGYSIVALNAENNSLSGINPNIMVSANINPIDGSVCLGKNEKLSFYGISCLSCSNFHSPLNRNMAVTEHYPHLVSYLIKRTSEIYKEGKDRWQIQ